MKRSVAPVSGILYAVLVVVGLLLLVLEEIDSATDEKILSHYTDSGNRQMEGVGFFLITAGVLFFLWFVSTLRTRLRSVESDAILSTLAFGAGVSAGGLMIGSAAVLSSTSLAVEASSNFVIDANLARSTVSLGYLFLVGSVLVNCVLVVATSLLALRADVLPSWLGWAGFAAVVLAIGEVFLLPVFVIPVWVVVVSVVLMRSDSTADVSPAGG